MRAGFEPPLRVFRSEVTLIPALERNKSLIPLHAKTAQIRRADATNWNDNRAHAEIFALPDARLRAHLQNYAGKKLAAAP